MSLDLNDCYKVGSEIVELFYFGIRHVSPRHRCDMWIYGLHKCVCDLWITQMCYVDLWIARMCYVDLWITWMCHVDLWYMDLWICERCVFRLSHV